MGDSSSALDASEANPGDIIPALQALQIKGVENTDMQKMLKEILERSGVREWENLLAAAPNALYAIGQCFTVAISGDLPQITQQREKSIPADLRTNLVHCTDLGLETFADAEDTMGSLRTTILSITECRGIMDKILDSVEDIKDALESRSSEALEESSEELAEHLGGLKKRAEWCATDTESVVKKFSEWHSEVKKINLAYTEVLSEETVCHKKLEEETQDLLARLKNIGGGDENTKLLKKFQRFGFVKKRNAEARRASRSDPESGLKSLNAQLIDKKSVIEVLGHCLDNLKQIKESLELLSRFFKALRREIEDLSGLRLEFFTRDVSRRNLTRRKFDGIRYDAYKIRCQYMHAASKASIYVEVSEKYIIPGSKLLNSSNRSSVVSDGDMRKKLLELSKYHEDALEGIKVFVRKFPTHAQLMKQIEDGALASGE